MPQNGQFESQIFNIDLNDPHSFVLIFDKEVAERTWSFALPKYIMKVYGGRGGEEGGVRDLSEFIFEGVIIMLKITDSHVW